MVEGFNKVESLKLKVESDFDLRKMRRLSKWYRVTIPQSFSDENDSPLYTRGPNPSGYFFTAGASYRPTLRNVGDDASCGERERIILKISLLIL